MVTPNAVAMPLVIAFAVGWLVASFIGILEGEQLAVMSMMQAVLCCMLGPRLYKAMAGPLLYLFFLVPSGAFLIPSLQAFTANFAVEGLRLLGIPVFSNGAVIEIPAGTFVVAEACAGLRFLVAAVAFGVFFGLISFRSWLKRVAFAFVSIVVPVIANGFRALGLIAAAQWIGSPQAALADHIIYGWIFFSIVLLLLIAVGQWFSDDAENDPAPQIGVSSTAPLRKRWVKIAVVGTSCCLVVGCAKFADHFLFEAPAMALPQVSPLVRGPWHKLQAPPRWNPVVIGASRTFSESFSLGSHVVDRFVALYGARDRGESVVRSDNRDADEKDWSFDSRSDAVLSVSGTYLPVRVTIWRRGEHKRTVWSFFVVNGRVEASVWRVKREELQSHFVAHPCISAFVAVSSETTNTSADATFVARLLEATEPLSPYLCRPTKSRVPR